MPTFAHWAEFFWTRPYTRPRTPADADQRSCNQKVTRTLTPAHGAQYTGTAHLIVTAFRDLGEVQLELNTRARVESIARGLSDDELRHLEAIASGKFGTVNKTVLERFMALNLIKHGPDGLGITLDGIRVVAVWHRAR